VFDVLQNLAHGFSVALTPTNLMFAFAGVLDGIIIGALPGGSSVVGVSQILQVNNVIDPT
jgi:putative tricarboxylic transport membrane protein